jgi:hypothetical protein
LLCCEPGQLSQYSDWLRAVRPRCWSSSPDGGKNFHFSMSFIPALGPIQLPSPYVPGALSLGVTRLGREADHSPPASAEVKKSWVYTSILLYSFMAQCLVKHRNSFTFTFTYVLPRFPLHVLFLDWNSKHGDDRWGDE